MLGKSTNREDILPHIRKFRCEGRHTLANCGDLAEARRLETDHVFYMVPYVGWRSALSSHDRLIWGCFPLFLERMDSVGYQDFLPLKIGPQAISFTLMLSVYCLLY